ncbi:hypothetical protein JI721_15295 [Alicyclobacillus cycloheptanicus]|uniref:Uncharacterized protein n=1 Tax=Alicyclobacillus cycloheptanicus TaxID=1457 RepID=A0ABT9XDC9_9BACL|nr:hypothetical protein [Alicyclobacillus cycloheptanicus]MDQ0188302.1 hypothetical protein [Alicyclobacillus cycloheptanicus]WDM01018.1 hypothetical protein JI721_15295 [Alicyclobacillus cycloheptanicus]
MSSVLRSVAWFLVALVLLVVVSVFIHFLLRIALVVALLAAAYYLYARAMDMRRRRR